MRHQVLWGKHAGLPVEARFQCAYAMCEAPEGTFAWECRSTPTDSLPAPIFLFDYFSLTNVKRINGIIVDETWSNFIRGLHARFGTTVEKVPRISQEIPWQICSWCCTKVSTLSESAFRSAKVRTGFVQGADDLVHHKRSHPPDSDSTPEYSKRRVCKLKASASAEWGLMLIRIQWPLSCVFHYLFRAHVRTN